MIMMNPMPFRKQFQLTYLKFLPERELHKQDALTPRYSNTAVNQTSPAKMANSDANYNELFELINTASLLDDESVIVTQRLYSERWP